MERIEYRGVIDKSGWKARGPWDEEPDKIQWQDETTGLPCMVVRGPHGSWCGYVGVLPGHPLHGLDYSQCPKGEACPDRTGDVSWCDHTPESSLQAHGGITFAHGCSRITRERWEEWRRARPSLEAEAKRYPIGDAARRIKDWAGCFDDFEAFAKRAQATYICHLPAPGEPDDVWWFGFDCAHAGDFSPMFDEPSKLGRPTGWGTHEEYRDLSYVENEVRNLAKQLEAIAL